MSRLYFKKVTISTVAIISTLYLAVCFYYYHNQELIIFPASKIDLSTEFNFELKHKEFFLDTPDGARLNAVLFEAETPKGIVLHFHGNGENMMHMKYVAEPFISRNYSLLAMDYRSYGKSSGSLSEESLYSDAALFMQYLEDSGWNPSDIIIYGRSIGTSIAIQLAAQSNPRGVILYSPFYSLKSLVSEILPFIPVEMILKFPLESAKYMSEVSSPVLILHGDSDSVIPVSNAEKLSKIKGRLVVLKHGTHENLTNYPQFWSEIDDFLSSIIPRNL
ncbi:MAG: alpha/beta hydrolase [Candidatus Thiodiazotropha sp. 6PDIVS]